ncbi:hypothetical protein ONE63_001290 [Megalurothrips usitatus]|uniref:Cadherin domain-containing protein n=1 Tax=Megalurothrips usitatus TaxID=439358 RepID=A0AAV7XFT9_9NEOP|nr:hypothetical protein ONE63_001290 [Megalurothrips usitatus]
MQGLVLFEDAAVGDVVYTLKGEDPEGSPLRYGIVGTDRFEVDRSSGQVRVVRPLDREINDTLRFYVTLEDELGDDNVIHSGKNNLVQVEVSVIIADVNDNPPVFLGTPYEVLVPEDTKPKSVVFRGIQLQDPDLTGETLEVACVEEPQFPGACDKFSISVVSANASHFSGDIILEQELDYNERQFYQFTLVATDGTFNSTTSVEVKVDDVQNSPPVFQGSLTGVLEENDPIGTLVLKAQARDGDRGQPRQIYYELVNNPLEYFLLDSSTGELRTARPLDREALEDTTGVLKVKIRARELIDGFPSDDPLTSSTAEATVTIRDVNDEPPTFDRKEYSVSIPENAAAGTPLPHLDMTVTDSDIGTNSEFSLHLEDVSGAFAVEPSKAIGSTSVSIRVSNGSMDYENPNHRKFIILVVAEELHTEPRLSSTATVTVTVTDENDNAPVFDLEAYSASVHENASPGTVIATITAHDRDSGHFGEDGFVYQLIGDGAEKFLVNKKTGVILVAPCENPGSSSCLDYETKAVYFLNYKVTDDEGSSSGLSAVVPLKISLLDSNDNTPIFTSQNYSAVIDEGATNFEPPLVVEARDADKTSEVMYSIKQGNIQNLFAIDSHTGEVKVSNPAGLDMTNVPTDTIDLTVQASDGKFSSQCIVHITVLDVNNNHPEFEQETYLASLPEDIPIGTTVDTVTAVDADAGVNAQIKYKIQKGAFDDFSIEPESGVVKVANHLDFDRRRLYNIEVIAVDGGIPMLSGTTTLMVNVLNTNDKAPFFVPATQNTAVTEDTVPGTIFYTLNATDLDVNSSEALSFSVSDPITAIDKHGKPVNDTEDFKEFFSIDSSTGEVSVAKPLQRDVAAVVRITVVVTDITAPNIQQGKGTLVVNIIDVNDFPPMFSKPWTREDPRYKADLIEEQPVGTIVGTFTATDEDSNIQGYAIVPPSAYFEINNVTGVVRTTRRIDFEENNTLNFTVVAYDSGAPPLSSTADVTVNVININDMDPVFAQSKYEAAVKENAPAGTVVVKVKATDKDDGIFGVVTYQLIGEHSNDFLIDRDSGEITVAHPRVLDREATPEIVIQVMASDGAPPDTRRTAAVPVTIRILDVNDNPPVLTQHSYRATVEETVALNSPLVQLRAEDPDQGENAHVRYSIVSGNSGGSFAVDPETGVLFAASSLVGAERHFHLLVEASDGHFMDRADVNITVLDVNHNKPVFTQPGSTNASIGIPESNAEAGYSVMVVKAIDGDGGENGHVTYHFKVDNKNVQETEEFLINEETGEIVTKVLLDREVKEKYELVLVARDHGSPTSYETLRVLSINVIDANDNNPEFPRGPSTMPYHFSAPENAPPNVKIGRVEAQDPDEGLYARIYYYLIRNSGPGLFSIERTDGTLYTNATLDREKEDSYELYIKASNDPDFFMPKDEMNAMSESELQQDPSIAHVVVKVLDENDNPPQFEHLNYYAGVNAMANVDELVIQLTAKDPDLGSNGSIIYYIAASNLYKYGSNRSSGSIVPSPFNITQTGQLRTSNYMAEYNQDRFIIDVVAREQSPPERETRTKVHVWLYEPSQLVRVILSRPPSEVNAQQAEIVAELSNATQRLVVVDGIGPHVNSQGRPRPDWSDMYLHVVDTPSNTIAAIPEVLKVIDAKYDFLKDYYAGFAIENVVPAYVTPKEETIDSALAALIALLIVLFVGCVTVLVVCCCFRHWIVSQPSDMKKKDALIKKAIIDDLNTTENPLWIEQKLKLYEEQELTMQVFCEPDHSADAECRDSADFSHVDNTYATIQHPNRRGSHDAADDGGNYATLRGTDNHGNHRDMYEAALGFQGSTFQVPDQLPALPPLPGSAAGSVRVNHHHHHSQPHFVAELI